ncbi:G beta-like protein [Schistosoma japonicum]|uniref:G beta-like protein n=1 Tax=Schistosoma japonicum TaxID=6182 RepID=A0A4Z2DX11_SCHJA|nr:G beta-like protein [Schistosoma japonicum]
MVSDFTKNVNTVGFNDTGNWMFAGAEDRVAKIIDWRAGGNLWITRIYQCTDERNQFEFIKSQCLQISSYIHAKDLRFTPG